jgi:DNA invertase Pin-like site-specific DNA recombinase
MPIALAYTRVSTERQATEEKTSLADQRAAIEQLARRQSLEVTRWFTDAGASGATAEGRPGFMALLEYCAGHPRADTDRGQVLVLNDSRLGRFDDPEEAAYWRHHLRRLGWVVRFCEGDETEDRTARSVLRAIGAAQATEYRENVRRNARRGARSTVEAGYWRTRAPYGYRRLVVYPVSAAGRVLDHGQHKAPNEKIKLTPHAEEARIVRWAFDTYAAGGRSLGSLSDELARREPRRRWSRPVVGAMLSNPAYRGAIVGGLRGGSGPYVFEDGHEPLVYAVQQRLEKNGHRGTGVVTHYMLSGVLRCVYCGEPYTGGGGGRSRNQSPERSHRRFYRDNGGVAGTCPGRIGTVMRHLVDDRAVEVIATTLAEPATRARIERGITEQLERAPGDVASRDVELRAAQRNAEKRQKNLLAAIADGAVLAREVAGQLEEIRAQLADIDARRQALRFSSRRAESDRARRDRLLEAVLDLPQLLEAATVPERRELVEPWIGTATFDKVGRQLTLGVRYVPALPSLFVEASPASARHEEGGLIVRSTSLLQAGHEYRVAEAAEAMRRHA